MIETKQQQDQVDAELLARQAEIDKMEAKRQAELDKAVKKSTSSSSSRKREPKNPFDEVIGQASSTVGRELGKSIVRGILGSLTR
jgi:hypothetical protein